MSEHSDARTAGFCDNSAADSTGKLGSVTEESQILPIPGENGKYILKSNGFYCLNEDGTKENTPAVYYFDHFEIDGTVFDGYYYHDESGKLQRETRIWSRSPI